jgi:hypothetical protein
MNPMLSLIFVKHVEFRSRGISHCVVFGDGVAISTLRCYDETEGLLWRMA